MLPWTALRRALPLAALVTTLVLGAAASAATTSPVIADCNAHSQLTTHYTVAQLRTALNTMPPTVKEYTNCYDVINRALLAQVGSGSGGGGGSAGKGSGGSFLPVWLIIVLALLIVGGGTYAFLAYRRQASLGGSGTSGASGASPGASGAGPGPE